MQKQVTDLNIFVTLSNLQFPNLGMCVNRSIMMGEREIEIEREWARESGGKREKGSEEGGERVREEERERMNGNIGNRISISWINFEYNDIPAVVFKIVKGTFF